MEIALKSNDFGKRFSFQSEKQAKLQNKIYTSLILIYFLQKKPSESDFTIISTFLSWKKVKK
jgi:hypothetical protein